MVKRASGRIIKEERVDDASFKKPHQGRPGNLFLALILILIGFVFLLNNFGVLPWGIWTTLWRFWPVFLIIAGLEIILGKSFVASVIIASLGIGLIASFLVFSVASVNTNFESWLNTNLPSWLNIDTLRFNQINSRTETFTVPGDAHPNANRLNATVKIGAGKFTLTDSDSDNFLDLESRYALSDARPKISTKEEEGTLVMDIVIEDDLKSLFQDKRGEYAIALGKTDLPTNLTVNLGAGSLSSNLTKLPLEEMKLVAGLGTAELTFSSESFPTKSIDIEVGAGTLKVKIPASAFVKINYAVGAGTFTINGDRLIGTGSHTTQNFRIFSDPIEMTVRLGAGTVDIETRDTN